MMLSLVTAFWPWSPSSKHPFEFLPISFLGFILLQGQYSGWILNQKCVLKYLLPVSGLLLYFKMLLCDRQLALLKASYLLHLFLLLSSKSVSTQVRKNSTFSSRSPLLLSSLPSHINMLMHWGSLFTIWTSSDPVVFGKYEHLLTKLRWCLLSWVPGSISLPLILFPRGIWIDSCWNLAVLIMVASLGLGIWGSKLSNSIL